MNFKSSKLIQNKNKPKKKERQNHGCRLMRELGSGIKAWYIYIIYRLRFITSESIDNIKSSCYIIDLFRFIYVTNNKNLIIILKELTMMMMMRIYINHKNNYLHSIWITFWLRNIFFFLFIFKSDTRVNFEKKKKKKKVCLLWENSNPTNWCRRRIYYRKC